MFACLKWNGDGFEENVFEMLPARDLSCFFLPNAILFSVPSAASFLEVRGRLDALAAADARFTFAVSLHTGVDTFGGHATFALPAVYHQIVAQ